MIRFLLSDALLKFMEVWFRYTAAAILSQTDKLHETYLHNNENLDKINEHLIHMCAMEVLDLFEV